MNRRWTRNWEGVLALVEPRPGPAKLCHVTRQGGTKVKVMVMTSQAPSATPLRCSACKRRD
jgi:hypothetical protein